MKTLTPKDRKLLWQYALGDSLSESDRLHCEQLLAQSEAAQKEVEQHRAFASLMATGKQQQFKPEFVDRTMGTILHAKTSQPVGSKASLIHQLQNQIRSWVWPSTGVVKWTTTALAVLLVLIYTWGVRPYSVYAPPGNTEVVMLADGSEVTLGSGASIRVFPSYLRSQRKIELNGEAFFDVEPANKPFIVQTFNATVEVKGTQFNVRAWPDDLVAETSVAVRSGLVEVSSHKDQSEVILLKKDQGTVVTQRAEGPLQLQAIEVSETEAWRTGGLAFDDKTLADVLGELERRFDLKLTAPASKLTHRLSYFDANPDTVEEVLEAICTSLDLKYRKTANGYEVINDK